MVNFVNLIISATLKSGKCFPKLHDKVCSFCPLLNSNLNMENSILSEHLSQFLPRLDEYITLELRSIVEIASLDVSGTTIDVRGGLRIVVEEQYPCPVIKSVRLGPQRTCIYRFMNNVEFQFVSCNDHLYPMHEIFTKTMIDKFSKNVSKENINKNKTSKDNDSDDAMVDIE